MIGDQFHAEISIKLGLEQQCPPEQEKHRGRPLCEVAGNSSDGAKLHLYAEYRNGNNRHEVIRAQLRSMRTTMAKSPRSAVRSLQKTARNQMMDCSLIARTRITSFCGAHTDINPWCRCKLPGFRSNTHSHIPLCSYLCYGGMVAVNPQRATVAHPYTSDVGRMWYVGLTYPSIHQT